MNWSPYNQPKPVEEKSNRGKVILSIIAMLFGLWWYNAPTPPPPNPDDEVIVVDPDDKPKPIDDKAIASLKDTYVVRVYETEADKQKAWLVKLLDADSLWIDWFNTQGMSYHTIDPSSNASQAESFIAAAKKRNIDPPFFIHAKTGGSVINVIQFKEGMTVEDIKKSIQSKVK